MEFKKLGNTQSYISAIGQGMGMTESFSNNPRFDTKYINAIKLGIELGMSFIDTAEVYGNGHSEELAAKAIKGIRDKVFVATKVSPNHLAYKDVIHSAEESLARLRTDYIDLYQIHWTNPRIPLDETFQAMQKLVNEGKVRHIGVCNFTMEELRDSEKYLSKYSLASVQVEYNLIDRTIENNILPYCNIKGITTIAYSPLIQGKIAIGNKKIEKMKKIATKYDKSLAQIALNWLIMHSSVIAIPKAENPYHIRENALSCDFNLAENDLQELNNIFKPEILHIPIDRIRVVEDMRNNRKVYKTLEEAKENKFGFVPSPSDLAEDIINGNLLKPVGVTKTLDKIKKYNLVEGRIRYWAWVIAYGNTPIPAYLREDWK